MKKYLYASIIFVAAACSSNDAEKSEKLKQLEAERDKLKTEQGKLSEQISKLDEEILAAGGEASAAGKSALVSTKKLSLEAFDHYFEIQGSLEADRSISISPEIGGTVKRILVQEGQHVSAGQVILELDKDVIEQNLIELKQATELAKFVYEKQEKLWKQNIGSELQYRQAKTSYESYQAKLNILQTQRSKTMITAPFSGVVEMIKPKVGELVNPQSGQPVASIVNLDQLKVKANVSEGYVGKVKYGSRVSVFFPSVGKEYDAKITKIGSSINPNGRTFEIAASLANGGKDLLPNLIAKIKVRDYNNELAVVVPSQAILQDINGNSFVYLVVNKTKELPVVKKHPVKLGLTYNNETEIASGLTGDEEIVIEGVRNINDGDKISIAKK